MSEDCRVEVNGSEITLSLKLKVKVPQATPAPCVEPCPSTSLTTAGDTGGQDGPDVGEVSEGNWEFLSEQDERLIGLWLVYRTTENLPTGVVVQTEEWVYFHKTTAGPVTDLHRQVPVGEGLIFSPYVPTLTPGGTAPAPLVVGTTNTNFSSLTHDEQANLIFANWRARRFSTTPLSDFVATKYAANGTAVSLTS